MTEKVTAIPQKVQVEVSVFLKDRTRVYTSYERYFGAPKASKDSLRQMLVETMQQDGGLWARRNGALIFVPIESISLLEWDREES